MVLRGAGAPHGGGRLLVVDLLAIEGLVPGFGLFAIGRPFGPGPAELAAVLGGGVRRVLPLATFAELVKIYNVAHGTSPFNRSKAGIIYISYLTTPGGGFQATTRRGQGVQALKKLGYGLGGLLVVLLAAVLIVPGLIDWNAYKPEIASEIRKASGRDVALNGDLSFSVLPQPHLSVADARLANPAGAASPDMITLKELRVSVKLWPLLQGALEVDSVELVEPVILLEKLPDGSGNWVFAPQVAQDAGQDGARRGGQATNVAPTSSPVSTPAASPPKAGARSTDIRLDSLRIVNGTVIYRDLAAGVNERIDGITAEASAGSINGPFSLKGEMTAKGLPLQVQASVGQFAEKGTIPLFLQLRTSDDTGRLIVKGTVTDVESAPKLSAQLDVAGTDMAAFLARFGGGAGAAALAAPFSLKAEVEGNEREIELNGLAIALGQTMAAGTAKLSLGDVPVASVSLETDLLDANALAGVVRGEKPSPSAPAAASSPVPARPDSAVGVGAAASSGATVAPGGLPRGIVANVSLRADEVAWKQGRAREFVLAANLKDGVLVLETLSAKIPGNGEIEASGRVAGGEKTGLGYTGKVSARSGNLRATLQWLEATVSGISADRLRTLSVNASVSGNADQVQVSGIDARLDATRIAGGITLALRDRPAFGASVSIDQINLDSYLPSAGGDGSAAGSPAGGSVPGSKPASVGSSSPGSSGTNSASTGGPLAALREFDANLVLRIGNLIYRGGSIRDVSFDGTLQGGVLAIRDAGVRNFAGASGQVKGTLSGFEGVPVFKGTVAAASDDLTGLFRVAGIDAGVSPQSLGKMRLAAATDFAGDRLTVDANLQLGDSRTALKGGATGFPGQPRFDLRLESQHPDFVRLVRMFEPGFSPRNPRIGAFRLAAGLKGDPVDFVIEKIDGAVGRTTFGGTGSVRMAAPRPVVTLNLAAGVIPVTDFMAAPRRADAAGPARHADTAPAFIRVAATSPAASNAGAGARWSREKIDTAALGLIDATVDLSAQALLYDNIRVDAPKIAAVLKDRVLEVSRVSGAMFDGGFEMTGRLDGRGVPKAMSSLVIDRANVRKLLFDAAAFDLANGILSFRMELAAQGESQLDMIRGLAGTGRIDVIDGVVKGFDLRKVSDGLKNLNQVTGLLGVLSGAMEGGSTNFSRLDGTFKIDKGVMRTDDLKLLADAGAGNAAGYVDLPAWNMDMLAEFRLTEHPTAPPFRVRAVGAPDEPRRLIDFQALQSWALQRGVGRLIDKFVPGAKQQPAPASPGEQPAQPPAQQPQQIKPADVLKDLLKGLGR